MSDIPTKYEVLIEQYLRSILDISAFLTNCALIELFLEIIWDTWLVSNSLSNNKKLAPGFPQPRFEGLTSFRSRWFVISLIYLNVPAPCIYKFICLYGILLGFFISFCLIAQLESFFIKPFFNNFLWVFFGQFIGLRECKDISFKNCSVEKSIPSLFQSQNIFLQREVSATEIHQY